MEILVGTLADKKFHGKNPIMNNSSLFDKASACTLPHRIIQISDNNGFCKGVVIIVLTSPIPNLPLSLLPQTKTVPSSF